MWHQPSLLANTLDSKTINHRAYLAGFMDGDGSIHLAEYKPNGYDSNFRLALNASNACLKPLELFRETFGGRIDSYPPRSYQTKYQNQWRLGGPAARIALLDMIPFLQIKQSQARLGISYEEGRQAVYKPRPVSFINFAQKISLQLKAQKYESISYIVEWIEPAYLAGLFDSDGSVTIVRRSKGPDRNPVYSVSVYVGCYHFQPIAEFLQSKYGGSSFTSKRGLDCWAAEGSNAVKFLMSIQPWLLVKKEQAQAGCAFELLRAAEREGWTSHLEYSDDYYLQAEELYQTMRDLK